MKINTMAEDVELVAECRVQNVRAVNAKDDRASRVRCRRCGGLGRIKSECRVKMN